MSTDFDVVCLACKQRSHLGQRMATVYSFGDGSKDISGRERVAEKICNHLGHDLQIYECEDGPHFTDEMK